VLSGISCSRRRNTSTVVLGQVLHTRSRAIGTRASRVGGYEGSGLHGALDVIEVPDLVELIGIMASDHYVDATRSVECGEDVRRVVGRGGGRKNRGCGEELYGWSCH